MRLLLILAVLTSCAKSSSDPYGLSFGVDTTEERIEEVETKISALQLVSTSIQEMVESEFVDCLTTDDLTGKICEIAQNIADDLETDLTVSLMNFSNQLQIQIDDANTDLLAHQALLDQIQIDLDNNESDVTTLQGDIATLQSDISTLNSDVSDLVADIAALDLRLDDAESAITDLENLTASMQTTLDRAVEALVIGSENVAAGPNYEVIFAQTDNKFYSGFIYSYGPTLSMPNNPVATTNLSPTVTVTMTAHGLTVGDIVNIRDLSEGGGFTSGQLFGDFTVVTVPTANTFTLTMSSNATSTASIGGTVGVLRKVNGRGISQLWISDQVSDAAVRTTYAGSKPYNYIIRRRTSDVSNDTAEICYDSTNRLATFATINAAAEGGAGNIVCK